MIKKTHILIFFLIVLLTFNSCSFFKKKTNEDEEAVVIKKKNVPINMKDRILERDNSPIFGGLSKKGGGTTYEFATSNIMWRATLETLDFVPLSSVNYSGGIIITDWYSPDTNSKESLKIEIRFLDSELKASSIKVNSFKKKCENINNCLIAKNSINFNNKIKDSIIAMARELKIKEELKKNK